MIEGELSEAQQVDGIGPSTVIHAEFANIADRLTVLWLFARWKPETVFPAAANKHVPLAEENVIAGLLNKISARSGAPFRQSRSARITSFWCAPTRQSAQPM